MSTISSDYDYYEQLGLTLDTTEETASTELLQEDFLELMITELTYQDPFEPMDNTEMAAQFASFSTVSGIGELNDSFADLQSTMVNSQMLQAANLVGKQVVVEGSVGQLEEGGEIDGVVHLDGGASDIRVRIYASSGELVRELELGSSGDGDLSFSWDGLNSQGEAAAAGEYEFEVQGTVDGETVSLSTSIAAPVESVELNGGEDLVVNVLGIGAVDLDSISAIA